VSTPTITAAIKRLAGHIRKTRVEPHDARWHELLISGDLEAATVFARDSGKAVAVAEIWDLWAIADRLGGTCASLFKASKRANLGAFSLAAALTGCVQSPNASSRCPDAHGVDPCLLMNIATNPNSTPEARQMAQRLYWLYVDSKVPVGNDNAHKLIQSYSEQPQTVVVPVVPY
jgi:hypothetical protein